MIPYFSHSQRVHGGLEHSRRILYIAYTSNTIQNEAQYCSWKLLFFFTYSCTLTYSCTGKKYIRSHVLNVLTFGGSANVVHASCLTQCPKLSHSAHPLLHPNHKDNRKSSKVQSTTWPTAVQKPGGAGTCILGTLHTTTTHSPTEKLTWFFRNLLGSHTIRTFQQLYLFPNDQFQNASCFTHMHVSQQCCLHTLFTWHVALPLSPDGTDTSLNLLHEVWL